MGFFLALPAIAFPVIDPVAIELGPVAIRWYALAYITGLVLGWRYMRRLAVGVHVNPLDVDDFLTWATIGVVAGGRLGFVLFYEPVYFLNNPLEIPKIWTGGMSFHGGFLGVVAAAIWFCKKRGIDPWVFGDLLGCAAPIGLFFGRLANFVNAELWGRPTDMPWGVIFPSLPQLGPNDPGGIPRHPSQLYEAFLEGLLLFIVLGLLWRMTAIRNRPGQLMGLFIAGYGLGRFIVEYFRQYDHHLEIGALVITHGQMYSLPMILIGVAIMAYARRRTPAIA